MVDILKRLKMAGIIPVIQIEDAKDAVPLCNALRNGGLPVAEITFRTQAAADAIRNIHQAMPDIILGAGTVLTVNQVDQAIDAGASYIVSPGLNPNTVKRCQDRDVPIIAGCSNPTDIEKALEMGLNIVKFFPAQVLGGLSMIKALSGPFSQVNFIPTGGIDEKNLLEYLAFPQVAACGGSWMTPVDAIRNKEWSRIKNLTREAVNLMLGLELKSLCFAVNQESQVKHQARTLARLLGTEVSHIDGIYSVGRIFKLSENKEIGNQITLVTNHVDRAIWHLDRQEIDVIEDSRVICSGVTQSIQLKDKIAGFDILLALK